MSKVIHIANTDVEFEYANSSPLTLQESWSQHPLCLQFQYLPLLYAKSDDVVAVTELPEKGYLDRLMQTGWWPDGLPQMILLDNREPLENLECKSWGFSLLVKKWAEERGIKYPLPPDWGQVCEVNSKAFSFGFSTLREAALLNNEKDLVNWLKEVKGEKVIKTCFGLSGVGNRHVKGSDVTPQLLSFCQQEWKNERPVIAEPWLDRFLDFSTQWKILPGNNFECLGATRFETDRLGSYRGTHAGPEELLFGDYEVFLKEHKEYVRHALVEIASTGFFGHVGFDAFLYREGEEMRLNPLVEINGRQTMSLVALLLQLRMCPKNIFKLYFEHGECALPSLLPDHCHDHKGKLITYRRQLLGQFIS